MFPLIMMKQRKQLSLLIITSNEPDDTHLVVIFYRQGVNWGASYRNFIRKR